MINVAHAKTECSKDRRCVGITILIYQAGVRLCYDAIYTPTDNDNEINDVTLLYKKMERRGNTKTIMHRGTFANIKIFVLNGYKIKFQIMV